MDDGILRDCMAWDVQDFEGHGEFLFDTRQGPLNASDLRRIADRLDKLNEEYHRELETLIGEHGRIIDA